MTLTEDRVIELFKEYVPDDVEIVFEDHAKYIINALVNPTVQLQMRLGIYDEVNIWEDFLGFARAHTEQNRIVIDMALVHSQSDGLSGELAEVLIRHAAAHEAHHFEHGHFGVAGSVQQQLHRETECEDLIASRYPELEARKREVEAASPVYQRVYERVKNIRRGRGA